MPVKARPLIRETFPADVAQVRAALLRFETGTLLAPLTADQRDCLLLVLAEVLNNVAEHAYGGLPGPVAVTLCTDGDAVRARVVDQGCLAPPISAGRDVDPTHLPEGGFGLALIRDLTRDLVQRRRLGCNVLEFRICADNPA